MIVTQLCLTLCHSMNCSPSGFSVHGIFQARILEWVPFLFSRGPSWPRDRNWVSCIAGRFFTIWATREVLNPPGTVGNFGRLMDRIMSWYFIFKINTAKETLMYRTVLWTLWERERVGWFGRMALKHVKYHVWNKLPVQVRCTILDAWGWCTGTTQRDSMGREEGGGFRMRNTCIPVADSFWYLTKLIQFCKV